MPNSINYCVIYLIWAINFQKSKIDEIQNAGGDIATFSRLGVLLDSEADPMTLKKDEVTSGPNSRFLLQIFTKPVFDEDSFFLEVLERRGARGFGAGNIVALARSIVLYQQEQDEKIRVGKNG